MQLLILSLLFLSLSWNSIDTSNYLNYHTKFSQVETLIVSERFEEAQARIEKLTPEIYDCEFGNAKVIVTLLHYVHPTQK